MILRLVTFPIYHIHSFTFQSTEISILLLIRIVGNKIFLPHEVSIIPPPPSPKLPNQGSRSHHVKSCTI